MAELKTSDIIRRLALGKLNNLKMADQNNQTIMAASIPNVVMHINEALKSLYSKFLLSRKEIILNTEPEIVHYFIRYEYARSNLDSTQLIKYIDDSGCDGFDGRISKILEVFDGFGRQLHINKLQEPYSVFTPEYDCLQITSNHQSDQFYVIFQALHPIINFNRSTSTDDTINIPPALEKPLLTLVAAMVYMNMNGQSNISKGVMYLQDYERMVTEVEFRDSHSASENMSNSKLERSGYI